MKDNYFSTGTKEEVIFDWGGKQTSIAGLCLRMKTDLTGNVTFFLESSYDNSNEFKLSSNTISLTDFNAYASSDGWHKVALIYNSGSVKVYLDNISDPIITTMAGFKTMSYKGPIAKNSQYCSSFCHNNIRRTDNF